MHFMNQIMCLWLERLSKSNEIGLVRRLGESANENDDILLAYLDVFPPVTI